MRLSSKNSLFYLVKLFQPLPHCSISSPSILPSLQPIMGNRPRGPTNTARNVAHQSHVQLVVCRKKTPAAFMGPHRDLVWSDNFMTTGVNVLVVTEAESVSAFWHRLLLLSLLTGLSS